MRIVIWIFMGCLLLQLPSMAFAELPVGKVPPKVVLQGESGGRLDGSSWSSDEIKGKLFKLSYVDPDERDLNQEASEALKKLNVPHDQMGTITVLNLNATWIPSGLIKAGSKSAQEENPETIIVTDNKSVLVEKWNLKDDSFDMMIFGPDGKVLFSKDGKLSNNDISRMINIIKDNLK